MLVSRKGAAVTLTAAAMLVVGVDYATFAATGDSLILGTINQTHATTRLVKLGAGPALRLRSRGHSRPSLAVSSPARVRRLNADMLDGNTASTLATNAVTYKAGHRGDVYPGQAFFDLRVQPGAYQTSFTAFVVHQDVTPGESVDVICGLADFRTIGSSNPHIYTANSTTYSGRFPTLMSGAASVRVREIDDPGLLCVTSDGESFTLFKPLTASWTPINHDRITSAEAVAIPGARRSLVKRLLP